LSFNTIPGIISALEYIGAERILVSQGRYSFAANAIAALAGYSFAPGN
jgi:hypothetical protein